MVGDHSSPRLPAQVGRDTAGEQRLEAAARVRHLVAARVPAQRGTPMDLPRAR
ncbi:hypothetical protein [Actinomycetospora soli]|uniref:hypothetical protein n=1 Tax=Actinomycetospora soli TaxID=2893887 RepID=UPI001E543CF8|nr:hypothetical protein [Actinomycetospora soli]MCD2190170.1 hypothetical protein [Actinomycetospora soli]